MVKSKKGKKETEQRTELEQLSDTESQTQILMLLKFLSNMH